MMNELITVVIPVYNMVDYLEKAVKTLVKQTYKNYEIILIDDGSTDGGTYLCDKLAEYYEQIRTIHKKNGGLSSARNCGIENAKGKYIIFPDPDDWVDENYLQCFVEQLVNGADLEICGNYIVEENRKKMQNKNAKSCVLNRTDAICQLLEQKKYCGFAWNKLYHLSIINKYHLRFDEELGMAQDLHFAFRYIMKCEKISYNPEPHYFYYQHKAGVTNIKHPLTKRKISGLKTYQKLLEIAKVEIPEAVPIIGATLANLNLTYIYIYFDTKMNDPKLLNEFYRNLKKYKNYFFENRNYDYVHRMLGGIALLNPKLYYMIKKIKNR